MGGAKPKLVHIELLRVIAIYVVMMVHTGQNGFFLFCEVGGQNPFYYPYLFISLLWKALASPIFFVISGALLLGKDEPIGRIFKKRFIKTFIVLLVTSFVYYVYDWLRTDTVFSITEFVEKFYTSQLSLALWFLYAYLAILLMLPLLRRMARNMTAKEYFYFAAVSILFVGVIPILEYQFGLDKEKLNPIIRGVLFTSSSLVYFMMGYFFEHVLDKKYYTWKNAWMGIGLSLISLAYICYIVNFMVRVTGVCTEEKSQLFHTSLIAITTYTSYFTTKLFFMKRQLPQKLNAVICFVGSMTFGVYLLERILREETEFILDYLKPLISTLPACVVWITAAFCVGILLTWLLKRIPLIAKYI